MIKSRERSSPRTPRKPETAKDLAPLLRAYAVKQMDRGSGDAAPWTVIAEAMLAVAFQAMDKAADEPDTLRIIRKLHSAAESRLAEHPLFKAELYHPETGSALLNTYGFEEPGPSGSKPER